MMVMIWGCCWTCRTSVGLCSLIESAKSRATRKSRSQSLTESKEQKLLNQRNRSCSSSPILFTSSYIPLTSIALNHKYLFNSLRVSHANDLDEAYCIKRRVITRSRSRCVSKTDRHLRKKNKSAFAVIKFSLHCSNEASVHHTFTVESTHQTRLLRALAPTATAHPNFPSRRNCRLLPVTGSCRLPDRPMCACSLRHHCACFQGTYGSRARLGDPARACVYDLFGVWPLYLILHSAC